MRGAWKKGLSSHLGKTGKWKKEMCSRVCWVQTDLDRICFLHVSRKKVIPNSRRQKINSLELSVITKNYKFSPFTNVFKCRKCHGFQELPQGLPPSWSDSIHKTSSIEASFQNHLILWARGGNPLVSLKKRGAFSYNTLDNNSKAGKKSLKICNKNTYTGFNHN